MTRSNRVLRRTVCRCFLVIAVVLAAGCAAEPEPSSPPAVWLPANQPIPLAVANRVPLPPCGVVGQADSPTASRCLLDAYEARAGAELVKVVPNEGGSLIVIVRVLPGRLVEAIYGSSAPGQPTLWEHLRCDGIAAVDFDPGAFAMDCDSAQPVELPLPS